MNNTEEVEVTIIQEIKTRRDLGRKKYGVSMERTDLSDREWMQHFKEECLDAAIYAEKFSREHPGLTRDEYESIARILKLRSRTHVMSDLHTSALMKLSEFLKKPEKND